MAVALRTSAAPVDIKDGPVTYSLAPLLSSHGITGQGEEVLRGKTTLPDSKAIVKLEEISLVSIAFRLRPTVT